MGEARRRKQLDPTYGKPKERLSVAEEDFEAFAECFETERIFTIEDFEAFAECFETERIFTIEDYKRMGRTLFPESLLRRFAELMDSEQLIPDENREWHSSTPHGMRCALSWEEGVNYMKAYTDHIHYMTVLKSFCIAAIGLSSDDDDL